MPMRTLILFRHAKAERSAESGLDHDRALTDRGRADAALMGRVLSERGIHPDLALVSTATRTRQTYETAAEHFGDVEVRHEKRLYNASVPTLRALIEAAEADGETVVVVAHNPGLHELSLDLLTEGAASHGDVDKVARGFPTGTCAVFTFDEAMRPTFDALFTPKAFGGGADE